MCTTLTTAIYFLWMRFGIWIPICLRNGKSLSVPLRFDLVLRRLHLNTLFIIKFCHFARPKFMEYALADGIEFIRPKSQPKQKTRSMFNLKIKFYIYMMCRLSYVPTSAAAAVNVACNETECQWHYNRDEVENGNWNGMRFIDKINLISISITHATTRLLKSISSHPSSIPHFHLFLLPSLGFHVRWSSCRTALPSITLFNKFYK